MSLFKDKLRPLIEREWKDFVMLSRTTEEEKASAIPPVGIAFRNQFAKRNLAEEPPEVQQEVEEFRQGLVEGALNVTSVTEVDGDGDGDEEAKRVAQARSYHG